MQNVSKSVLKIVTVGLMAALVFAASNLSINLFTVMGSPTRIHLGNILCLLSGLLFGSWLGGFSAGIGSSFFDLFNPLYISSAPVTFAFKFLMGFTAGKISHSGGFTGDNTKRNIIAAIVGQLLYIVLYLTKSLVESTMVGNAFQTALVDAGTKGLVSLINGIIAVAVAVPLAAVIRKALRKTGFYSLIEQAR